MLFDGGFLKKLQYLSLISRRVFRGSLLALVIVCGSSLVRELKADDTDSCVDAMYPANVEFDEVRLRIVDQTGQPIADAKVVPQNLIWFLDRASNGASDYIGEVPRCTVSDMMGQARVVHSRFVYSTRYWQDTEVGQLFGNVIHPDYCTAYFNCATNSALAPQLPEGRSIRLERGTRLRITAYDRPGERPLPTCYVNLMQMGDEWKPESDGTMVSRPQPRERPRLQLVHLPTGSPAMYSLPVDWTEYIQPESDIVEISLKVYPGTRVDGQLNDTVPRPVRNGFVLAAVVSPGRTSHDAFVTWYDWTPVDADGRFTFDSLPKGEELQLVAICDGFISTCDSAERLLVRQTRYHQDAEIDEEGQHPQLFPLRGDTIRPTVKMRPAATCRIAVVDEADRPVAGARLRIETRFRWLHGSGGGPSWAVKTRDELIARREPQPQEIRSSDAITDLNGIASIPGLFPQPSLLYLEHPDLELPLRDLHRRMELVEPKCGRTTELKLTAVPKGRHHQPGR